MFSFALLYNFKFNQSNFFLDDNSYLRSDKVALLPKVAAISFGGMTGFLLSLRRYGKLRKVFYPFTGSLIMSAFCYPNETIDFIQIGLAHSERTWNNFKNCRFFKFLLILINNF